MIYRKICCKSGRWYLRLPRIAARISWQSSGRCGRPPDVVMPPSAAHARRALVCHVTRVIATRRPGPSDRCWSVAAFGPRHAHCSSIDCRQTPSPPGYSGVLCRLDSRRNSNVIIFSLSFSLNELLCLRFCWATLFINKWSRKKQTENNTQ